MTKRIMCYGDSNTWGYIGGKVYERFPEGVRWPSVLQSELGDGYRVLEEGYCGRTTVWDDPVELRPSGYATLIPILETCAPMDLVTIMLGTNDAKTYFTPNATNIAVSAALLARTILRSPYGPRYGEAPKVLLIAPPVMKDPVARDLYDDESVAISYEFAKEFKTQADLLGCGYLDAALYAEPDPADGVHISADSHIRLGKAVAQKILEML